ncbi:AlpA family transcriptional regulator [Burkholderia cenocepacia]|uniref:helix-turn-helix transcriptional regulator n=1 Tax=Burkholderia cenocepacia TaxID=95486 RepID=UPI000F5A93DE|nr:hypothetical protein [Burkholderia cenocepacia]RQU92479.1 hypothetical protein DF040_12785 [Burkholderia cenocepacia]
MSTIQGGAKRPKQAAAYIGSGLTTLWSLVKNDPMFPRPFKVGRMTLFYTAELDTYLARKAHGSRV